jgi:predicted NUDIX family NTP pyrophosphohydrolase
MSTPKPTTRSTKKSPLSAGVLLYRGAPDGLRVLLGHPGGPFWAKKDEGAWTIPKGLLNPEEDPQLGALREFAEELGWQPTGTLQPLGEVRLKSGKRVLGFALQTDEAEDAVLSRFAPGAFTMEWPPRSGKLQEFPEIDRIEFFTLEAAATKLNPAQAEFLDRLQETATDR